MNTRISYLYCDEHGYKQHNEIVLNGQLNTAQISKIYECLESGEYFIPSQVGLPEKRFDDSPTDADHCWFILPDNAFSECDAPATVTITPLQLTNAFLSRRSNWDDTQYVSANHGSTGNGELLKEYEKFRLQWMIDHGKTLPMLIKELQDMLDEADEGTSLQSLFEDWEFGYGFKSEIWPCYDEYLQCDRPELSDEEPLLQTF